MQDIETFAPISSLLQLFTSEEWVALRAEMDRRTYAAGEILVAQGTVEPAFQVIVEGATSVVAQTPAGDRRELGRLGSGECIGEMSLLTGEPASADVVALTPVTTYAATPTRLASMGELRTRLIEALSGILASRLKRANERLLARHPANTYVVHCDVPGFAAVAGLPRAIAATTGSRVLVLVAGAALTDAARGHRIDGPRVAVRRVEEPELIELPAMLAGLGHEFGEVMVLTEARADTLTAHGACMLEVARENTGARMPGTAALALIGQQPWTQPVLRRLSEATGRSVVGVLPAVHSGGGRGDTPIARLARVMTNRRVGLALGAGAAKGLAHLGVLRAFDELAIPVDVISGCSIGSAIAAGWASGLGADELTTLTSRIAGRAIRPTLPLRSFLSSKGIRDELVREAGERRFEDMQIPLSLVATDIFRRSEVTFTTGLLWPCILASMALPGVYPPVAANGSYLVDGAVLNPVPVKQCRELGAGVVIAVRLTGKRTSPREQLDVHPSFPTAVETISRTFEIMNNRISEMSHVQADVTIEVSIEGGGIRDFKHVGRISAEGAGAVGLARDRLAAAMPYIGAAA